MSSAPSPHEGTESFDAIVRDLQQLRESAGPIAYAELVRRITELRLARGMNSAAAIPARSTVYNAFRVGRTRMDTELLRDIVTALGVDEREAAGWVQRCQNAGRAVAGRGAPAKISALLIGLTLVACIAVNLVGLYTANVFKLSVYLDMVGTAIASIVLGPWHGVMVALASSSLGFVVGDPTTFNFALVNIAGALLWGYGIRRFHLGSRLSSYLTLNCLVAIGCTVIAAPVVVMVFGGTNGHASSQATLSLETLGLPLIASVISSNIVTSVVDKLLTGFIALAVFTLLHGKLGFPARHMPLVEQLGSLRRTAAPTSHTLTHG